MSTECDEKDLNNQVESLAKQFEEEVRHPSLEVENELRQSIRSLENVLGLLENSLT